MMMMMRLAKALLTLAYKTRARYSPSHVDKPTEGYQPVHDLHDSTSPSGSTPRVLVHADPATCHGLLAQHGTACTMRCHSGAGTRRRLPCAIQYVVEGRTDHV